MMCKHHYFSRGGGEFTHVRDLAAALGGTNVRANGILPASIRMLAGLGPEDGPSAGPTAIPPRAHHALGGFTPAPQFRASAESAPAGVAPSRATCTTRDGRQNDAPGRTGRSMLLVELYAPCGEKLVELYAPTAAGAG